MMIFRAWPGLAMVPGARIPQRSVSFAVTTAAPFHRWSDANGRQMGVMAWQPISVRFDILPVEICARHVDALQSGTIPELSLGAGTERR